MHAPPSFQNMCLGSAASPGSPPQHRSHTPRHKARGTLLFCIEMRSPAFCKTTIYPQLSSEFVSKRSFWVFMLQNLALRHVSDPTHHCNGEAAPTLEVVLIDFGLVRPFTLHNEDDATECDDFEEFWGMFLVSTFVSFSLSHPQPPPSPHTSLPIPLLTCRYHRICK